MTRVWPTHKNFKKTKLDIEVSIEVNLGKWLVEITRFNCKFGLNKS